MKSADFLVPIECELEEIEWEFFFFFFFLLLKVCQIGRSCLVCVLEECCRKDRNVWLKYIK